LKNTKGRVLIIYTGRSLYFYNLHALKWRVALLGIAQRHISVKYIAKRRRQPQRNPLGANLKAIGNWITLERQKRNLTVYQLALNMSIATSLVHEWENGISEPNESQWHLLNQLLR
jgi:DNA-binding transcriptional regulator YiaG